MRYTFLLAIIVLFNSCNSNNEPSSSSAGFDSIFDSVFKADEPGGAVLIAKDGKVIYEKGFGIADINSKTPIDSKKHFLMSAPSAKHLLHTAFCN